MKTIDAKKLHAFGVEFLKAYGASQENAVIITDHLVDNDLKGIEAHGAMRLFEYAKFMVDGCLRDKEEIASHKMPVYCKGSGTKPYAEELQLAAVNVPIDIDGCRVVPGDIVVGDDDGIVVIPADRAEEIVYQAEDIADIEIKLAEAVERQASLEELGVIGGRKAVVRK